MLKLKTLLEVKTPAQYSATLASIGDDMAHNFRPEGKSQYGSGVERDDTPMIDVPRKSVEFSIRYLGNWDVPADVRDTPEGEDYDWKEWSPGEYEKYDKMFKDWVKSRPWSSEVKKASVHTGEKEWVYFRIELN